MCRFKNKTHFDSHIKLGKGKSFGTFGELLQGVISEKDLDFLVTFPIASFAHATFHSDPTRLDVEVTPAFKTKSRKIAELILCDFGLHSGGKLVIQSEIPVGKGLASSSADLVATARAISACFQLFLNEKQIEDYIRQIEPSDGVMYSGVVSFYHKEMKLREFIGPLPSLTVVGIDEGGQVDTIQFNQIPKPFTAKEKLQFELLLQRITKAIREQDLETIGLVSTQSAILNQVLKPKKYLYELIELSNEIGGLGVLTAHSGTCLGILFSPADQHYKEKILLCHEKLKKLQVQVVMYHSWMEGKQKL